MQPPSCKLVVMRLEGTGCKIVQGYVLWVGIILALWRVDGGMIIWSFLERFWLSFYCCIDFLITSVIFRHEGLG